MWRNVMMKKEGVIESDRTLTMDDLESIHEGDYIIAISYGYEPGDSLQTQPLFVQGKEYAVLEVKTTGVITESEQGRWWIDFSEGLGKFFVLRQRPEDAPLSLEEELGELEYIPYAIMKLLHEHGDVPRSRIITALMQTYHTDNRGDATKLRNDIIKAMSLLFETGKIQHSDKVGIYKLTPEGLKEMWEGGKTNREKLEEGTF